MNPWPSFTGPSQYDHVTVESSTFWKRVVISSSSLVEKLFPMTGTKCTRKGKLSSGFPRSASPDMLKVGCFYVFSGFLNEFRELNVVRSLKIITSVPFYFLFLPLLNFASWSLTYPHVETRTAYLTWYVRK